MMRNDLDASPAISGSLSPKIIVKSQRDVSPKNEMKSQRENQYISKIEQIVMELQEQNREM